MPSKTKKEEQKLLEGLKDAAIVLPGQPGYQIAKDIAEHGRMCKLRDCCYCKSGDRENCFDWVKV